MFGFFLMIEILRVNKKNFVCEYKKILRKMYYGFVIKKKVSIGFIFRLIGFI